MMFMHMRRDLVYICKNSCFSLSLVQSFSTSRAKQNHSAVFELLVHKHHLCPEAATQVALSFSRMKSIDPCDSVVSFLKEMGFSNPQLEKMLKCRPRLLSANLEKVIKPKIKVFQDSGFSGNDISQLITNNPDIILHRSLKNKIIPSLLALKDLYGSDSEVAKAFKICRWPWMRYDVEKTIVPNVEYLKSCGVAVEQISWLMYRFPRTLSHTPQNMMEFVNRVDEMGIERSSKMFIHAIRVLSQMTDETWERKWKAFENLGFSKDEIMAVCRKAPQLFCVSEEKMNKLKEAVLGSGKYDISCVVRHPTSLICSIEKRYKPRIKVLRILESHNLIKDWPSFSAFYKMTDEGFFKNYGGPYLSKVGDLREFESLFSGK